MNANDVLIDLLEDNRRRLRRVFGVMSDECLVWKPRRRPTASPLRSGIWRVSWMSS